MTENKLDVFFAYFPYGGNGGTSSEVPQVKNWSIKTLKAIQGDARIGRVGSYDFSDTPITMTRNRAVREAQKGKYDVLVMCDSDMAPDYEVGTDPMAKPFWQSSFDFLYGRRIRGEYTVVGAPYCGPPPHENVYVFQWANFETGTPQPDFKLSGFGREEASRRAGIEEVAALPTGLIMFDMRVFDIVYPPYFYYEYTDEYESEKSSTEDVTATRDMSVLGKMKLGYSPIHVNWDAWAGHIKPKIVIKPRRISVSDIAKKYQVALATPVPANEKLVFMNAEIPVILRNGEALKPEHRPLPKEEADALAEAKEGTK